MTNRTCLVRSLARRIAGPSLALAACFDSGCASDIDDPAQDALALEELLLEVGSTGMNTLPAPDDGVTFTGLPKPPSKTPDLPSSSVPPRLQTPVILPHPVGIGTVSVSLFGGPCPIGTWETRLTSDRRIELQFHAVALMITPRYSSVGNYCSFKFLFNGAGPRQLAVRSISYEGYVFLAPGVQAQVRPDFDLHNGVEHVLSELTFDGPQDDVLTGAWTLPARDEQEWTSCLTSNAITGKLQYLLHNPGFQGSGIINVFVPVRNPKAAVTFEILTRSCTPSLGGEGRDVDAVVPSNPPMGVGERVDAGAAIPSTSSAPPVQPSTPASPAPPER